MTGAGVFALFNSKNTPQERRDQFACMIFGLPLTTWGSWIAHGLHRDRCNQEQVKLQTAFFKILKETDGQITPLALSMETGLSGETTREFLDQKAKEFHANFEVDEQGDLFYRFNLLGGMKRPEAL